MMVDMTKLEELTDHLKQYMLLNIRIIKLEAISKISTIASTITGLIVVGMSLFLFVFTMTMGLGFYISELIGDAYSGFAIVAVFYLLLTLLLYFGRKRMIEKPFRNKIVSKILEEEKT
jgi:Zn-dependent protease with chaperone function